VDNGRGRLRKALSLFPEVRLDESLWAFKDPSHLSAVVKILFEEGLPEARFLNLLAVVDQGPSLELHHGFGESVFGWDLCMTLELEKTPQSVFQLHARLMAPSFESFYPYQALQWRYLGELYGIQFGQAFEETSCFLPVSWKGFPLRKDAKPATEFEGFVSVRFQSRHPA
jgi:hypothetical protein